MAPIVGLPEFAPVGIAAPGPLIDADPLLLEVVTLVPVPLVERLLVLFEIVPWLPVVEEVVGELPGGTCTTEVHRRRPVPSGCALPA